MMLFFDIRSAPFLLVSLMLCRLPAVRVLRKCCNGNVCYNNNAPYNKLLLPQCADEYKPRMNLYTRSNNMDGQLINKTRIPSAFDASRQTVFLVHGWKGGDDPLTDGIPFHEIKNEFLKEGDYNVIIVGWEDGASDFFYIQSAANTRSVGMEIALVVRNLVKVYGDSIRSKITCTGHSLGAHVCGFAGKNITLGRCTGLDPARPLFEYRDHAVGLQQDCADYVDVMHTSSGLAHFYRLGLKTPVGHVDFYPNGGGPQPQCTDPFEFDCAHNTALFLYKESIDNKCFLSYRNCSDVNNLPSSCTTSPTVLQSMGWDSVKHKQNTGVYYLNTVKVSPYCRIVK